MRQRKLVHPREFICPVRLLFFSFRLNAIYSSISVPDQSLSDSTVFIYGLPFCRFSRRGRFVRLDVATTGNLGCRPCSSPITNVLDILNGHCHFRPQKTGIGLSGNHAPVAQLDSASVFGTEG